MAIVPRWQCLSNRPRKSSRKRDTFAAHVMENHPRLVNPPDASLAAFVSAEKAEEGSSGGGRRAGPARERGGNDVPRPGGAPPSASTGTGIILRRDHQRPGVVGSRAHGTWHGAHHRTGNPRRSFVGGTPGSLAVLSNAPGGEVRPLPSRDHPQRRHIESRRPGVAAAPSASLPGDPATPARSPRPRVPGRPARARASRVYPPPLHAGSESTVDPGGDCSRARPFLYGMAHEASPEASGRLRRCVPGGFHWCGCSPRPLPEGRRQKSG